MRFRQFCAATAVAGCLAVPAQADVTVYYHAGGWDAFEGQDAHGTFCGIGTHNPADGRTFSLRFVIGGNSVLFIATKPGWAIPAHTQVPVVMQVGLERPWTEPAVGDNQNVQWTMEQADVTAFDAQFRHASSMTLTFPNGTERPWVISLSGSNAVSNTMGRCVTDMTQRAAAAQPAPAGIAPAGQNATQPFGTGGSPQPAAPAQAPAPTQPNAPQATDAQPTQPNAPASPTH